MLILNIPNSTMNVPMDPCKRLGGLYTCLHDAEFTLLSADAGFLQLTGYDLAEAKSVVTHSQLIFADHASRVHQEVMQQLAASSMYFVRYRLIRRDGSTIWVLDQGMLVKNPGQGEVVHCMLTDISTHIAHEQLLGQKSFELETITNNIDAAIIRCDFNDSFTITYANDGFFRMLSYTRQQFWDECSNSLGGRVHPDDVASMTENLTKQLAVGNSTANINRVVRRDGSWLWVLAKGTVFNKQDGSAEFHGVLTDITEQQERAEALRVSEKKYEIAMNFADVSMFEYNVVTKTITVSLADAQKYNLPSSIANGVEVLSHFGVVKPISVKAFQELYAKIDAGAPFARAIIHLSSPTGEEGIFELSLTNIFDSSGKSVLAVGVKRDLTETMKLEREKQYSSTMVSNQTLTYEANITANEIISYNGEWVADLGIEEVPSFSDLMFYIMDSSVAPEHRFMFIDKMSRESLVGAFEKGQRLLSLEYRKKVKGGDYFWCRKNINIIKDKLTEDIIIRCFTLDINEQKEKELKATQEQQYYESMVAKSIAVYSLNVTKNIIISGHETWKDLLGFTPSPNYMQLILDLYEKAVHPEDRALFLETLSLENIITSYAYGERELYCEYRRPYQDDFIWVRTTAHLFEDPQTEDIKAFFYVENIHESKMKALEIIYKSEHDLLTGLLNKVSTERYIEEFLRTPEGKVGKHAFFIMDTDYFKSINDNFGHAFGDAVLSQLANRLKLLFRDVDILGRIGGDEFVMFMKNIQHLSSATVKAQEICNKVIDTFTQKGKSYHISASVGIAIYGEDGKNYSELYKNSDTALYVSKENGRNRFTLYSDNMEYIMSKTNEILTSEYRQEKTFAENVLEYVFRILYESKDKVSAINSVLELIGKHYNISRSYIFESSYYGDKCSNTFEWCDKGIKPEKDSLQKLSYAEDLDNYQDSFGPDGIFFMADMGKLSPKLRATLKRQNVKSMLQFSVLKDGKFKVIMGFDECKALRIVTKKEITELRSITNVLGVFIMKIRAAEENSKAEHVTMSIIDKLHSRAYVCDPISHKLLFSSQTTLQCIPQATAGKYCYEVFWNKTAVCKICPMAILEDRNLSSYSTEVRGSNFGKLTKCTASWIDWLDGEKKCLMENIDIN